ncbi:hypothetical protein DCS_06026 [Drechmeria coniospora]|uniref:Uncharacterized protein n=1 Tax=Drechmeria coniospora TaxID=98403 RepID=A0A151GAF8_DRECN|nr:hypothetical protein DCS_06026 [Drechmeria coniospora]KYK54070.1 hypothetical protein DCS_06026 [Drechmeria coniospora]
MWSPTPGPAEPYRDGCRSLHLLAARGCSWQAVSDCTSSKESGLPRRAWQAISDCTSLKETRDPEESVSGRLRLHVFEINAGSRGERGRPSPTARHRKKAGSRGERGRPSPTARLGKKSGLPRRARQAISDCTSSKETRAPEESVAGRLLLHVSERKADSRGEARVKLRPDVASPPRMPALFPTIRALAAVLLLVGRPRESTCPPSSQAAGSGTSLTGPAVTAGTDDDQRLFSTKMSMEDGRSTRSPARFPSPSTPHQHSGPIAARARMAFDAEARAQGPRSSSSVSGSLVQSPRWSGRSSRSPRPRSSACLLR